MKHNSGLWVIWSNEHHAWWRDGSLGYTSDLLSAGIYTEDTAKGIVDEANRYEPDSEWTIPWTAAIVLAGVEKPNTVAHIFFEHIMEASPLPDITSEQLQALTRMMKYVGRVHN